MELEDFYQQLRSEVKIGIAEKLETDAEYPFPEDIFTSRVLLHMIESGMTFDGAEYCHYEGKSGNASIKISGYAFSENSEQLDLFITLYEDSDSILSIPDSDTKFAANQCVRFFVDSMSGKLGKILAPSSTEAILANTIQGCQDLDQVRIFVLTNKLAKAKNYSPRPYRNITIKLEVMDIERLYRHIISGKPRDELVINFVETCGFPLPCVFVPQGDTEYAYALTAIPGDTLRFLYEKYGGRLLEANVRSFLNTSGNINRGIRDTLRNQPERFMAYNNGLVIVADEIRIVDSFGGVAISWLKGMQIVNGGQTTASLYFTKKKYPNINLSQVRIPAKLIIFGEEDSSSEETLISDISRYANSQNTIRLADLSSNKPFHRELEKIANMVFCPDGIGQWFYERTTGSYNVMLARESSTPAKLKHLKERIPTSRKISKTDLAKYINTWEVKPSAVAFGAQKNFKNFMEMIENWEKGGFKPDIKWFKEAVAKAIIFKQADRIVAALGTASKIHVTTHLVAIFAEKFSSRTDFERIWQNQGISSGLKDLLTHWAPIVNRVMLEGSQGMLLSEWAKQKECWEEVKKADYDFSEIDSIPEII